ncbi:CaiB/BaiF CoA-transferase family protein [Belnapia rosea]|uniref:CaiB/BaiF CoA-transferase family protein n=1 Tax=Belnapia rosea TaxID=938405 RepID=UPI000884D97D|nr:CoA transferase [Belnapia rosea]SDB59848.1 Crotonobetainyl-CoA:carnitine CoA-transferase CaiB [Belnapia rosea]
MPRDPEAALPLRHLRVLERGGGVATAYAGKLFSDFGAQVTVLEPPGGHPLRAEPPLVDTPEGPQSALFAWLSTNKRSVTRLDGIDDCDVLLDGRPPAERDAASPSATITAGISWFGDGGPYRDFAATDATCRALSGILIGTGPVEGPPSILGGIAGAVVGGIAAFNAVAAALLSGAPRRLEVSIHEANVAIAEYQAAQAITHPMVERRHGVNRFAPSCPLGVYPCREGWLGVTIVTPAQFRSFCDMIGAPEVGHDPRFVVGFDRLAHVAELEALFVPRLRERTAEEWFEEALRRRLPFAVVPDMARLLATPTHRARDAFATVQLGERQFEGPTLPQRLTRTPPLTGGRAPRPGEHDGQPLPERPRRKPARPAGLPLAGLRIVDLSMGWAGPLCTRQLADLGAEVVKVEACQYPDWWRGVDPRPAFFAERQYERDLRFGVLNRNKAGITLDLTTPEGAALLKRLVREADAVVENYAREVLPKLGLDYPALVQERPDLVMVSMPAFGGSGPWRDARAYGSTLEHASGLPSVSGNADWPPTTNQLAYGDPIGGLNAAAAVLTALLHRRETGEGQHIDLAQVECMFPLVAPWILAQSANGSAGPRLGNRHPRMVPHGCFPCSGEGWIALAVTEDAAWPRLCAVIGREDLAADPALAKARGRRAREAEIEAAIAAWTTEREADAAMAALQSAGIAAGALRWPTGLVRDPHLRARGFWQPVERPWLGHHDQPSAPFREAGGGPYAIRRPAPTLGEDNDAVLGGLLGLPPAERAALAAAGIIGTEAIPVAQRKSRAAGQ